MKMIERMALAMLEADAWPIGKSEAGQALAQHLALAALKAMREPTDLMGNGLPNDYKPGSHSATQIWNALIDAAIKEAEAG